jgi:hypothetical protein
MHTRASIPSAVALPLAPLESLHRAVAGLVMLLIVARTGMALGGEILAELVFIVKWELADLQPPYRQHPAARRAFEGVERPNYSACGARPGGTLGCSDGFSSGGSSTARAVPAMQSDSRTTLRMAFHTFVFSFVFNAVLAANF